MKIVNSAVPVIGGQSKKSYIETLRAIATLTLVFGASIFVIIKECCKGGNTDKRHKIRDIICLNSFAIYLIHPFWINLIFKAFKITPISFPIYIGIPVLFLVVLIMSLLSGAIVRKIPLIREIL